MRFTGMVAAFAAISLRHGVYANDASTSLRGSVENSQRRRALRVKHACTLVVVETQFEDELANASTSGRERMWYGSGGAGGQRKLKKEKHEVKCELKPEDRANSGKHFVSINGIETDELDNIVSGDTTLIAEGATIMDGEMWLPAGAAIEFGSNGGENRRRLQASRTKGIKKVLVVRANANDSMTTASKEILSDKIFGTNGDLANLRSQYNACSHGQIDLQPFNSANVKDGVLDVTVNMNVKDANRYSVEDALEEAADKLVGNLRDQFDHVMLCLPPGSAGINGNGWVAYGYVNSWLSVYNDGFCESLSTQVHEIGHNLGLAHSGKDGISYGDKSGMMGYSYNKDNYPLQCFNPAKSYQLGWFSNKVVEHNPDDGTWVGTLIGGADYTNKNLDWESKVVVKVANPLGKDLYIGYNRKKDMNFQVPLAGDEVTIIEQGQGYSQSNFIASLDPGFFHTFYNFGGSNKDLVVQFIDHGQSFDEAKIAIYYNTCVYPSCCEGSMCGNGVSLVEPSFPTPISAPIPAPQPMSTTPPTQLPTGVPTGVPTAIPTGVPTKVPTGVPTGVPTANLTPAPTTFPTLPPQPPTPAPTRSRVLKRPKPLLFEMFRKGLGAFKGGGDDVSQNLFNHVMTAKFELKTATDAPYLETNLNLKGTSIIQVNFWYNIQRLQSREGFRLQYSADNGPWKDIRRFAFTNGDFERVQQWNYVNSVTFEVEKGTSEAKLRFVADLDEDNSKSVFYITGVNIYGIEV